MNKTESYTTNELLDALLEKIKSRDRIIKDLSTLVGILSYHLKKHDADNPNIEKARNYLNSHELTKPNILRNGNPGNWYTRSDEAREMTPEGFLRVHKKIMKKLKKNPIKISSDK